MGFLFWMVDENCKYYNDVPIEVSGELFYGCNVTHGFCDSDDHNSCDKYEIEEKLEKKRQGSNLEVKSNG